MNCLHCGDCCERSSPLSSGPCPWIVRDGSFVLCTEYECRPKQCRLHEYPFPHCPIGVDILGLTTALAVSRRIDEGYRIALALEKN